VKFNIDWNVVNLFVDVLHQLQAAHPGTCHDGDITQAGYVITYEIHTTDPNTINLYPQWVKYTFSFIKFIL
jgi:hypothetical protein